MMRVEPMSMHYLTQNELAVVSDYIPHSLPVSYRLYLPRDWAEDPARRAKAGVPEEIAFRTKPEIALDLLRAAAAAGLPPALVVTDAGYGKDTGFRTGVSALGL